MTTLWTNLLTLRRSRWVCVLDPSLLLSPYGVPIAKELGKVMELWVVRELWHILDNTQFYVQHPELIQPEVAATTANNEPTQPEMNQVLQRLEQWRMNTDPTRLNVFWIGDRPNESLLPADVDPHLSHRWEFLAQALNRQLKAQDNTVAGLDVALRDTVALSVALSASLILTFQGSAKHCANCPPDLCLTLENWGFTCQQLDGADPIVNLERDHLLQLLVSVGVAKFLWSGLHLAILHIVAPSACLVDIATDRSLLSDTQGNAASATQTVHVWQGAQGFWYWL